MAPSIRSFQLDGSAIGNAAKSVNLYRGDLNLPLKLVDLPGPHGLDLSLAAYYSSNLQQQWDTWNRQAPTGILGLGWSLPLSRIEFDGQGTASWLEGSFTLYLGGAAHPLILLSYTGTAADGDEALSFADPANPTWTLAYTPATETWQVQRDDGVGMVFGDGGSGRCTVQWGVRWGNWAGNSSTSDGSPTRYALAWNLSTMTNPWGQSISYAYLEDTAPVTASLSYTRASYLASALDGYGRTVEFSYADKDPLEYQAPHTVAGATPTAGYQDRYETRYLAQVDVYSPGGTADENLYYSLLPDYQLHDPEQAQLTETCKRYLVALQQQRHGIDLLPAMQFGYQLDSSQPGPGRLQQVSYPSGGTVDWTYADVDLADPSDPSNVFNLSYTAARPSGSDYSGATPRLWFASDYVIIAWYNGADLALRVYSYGGRWSEPYCYEIEGVDPQLPEGTSSSNANLLAQIRIAIGPSFFALHYHNTGNGTDKLRIFQKAIDQFGLWTVAGDPGYDCELFTSSVVPEETALVAGNDFVALHVGGSTELYRFRYSPVSQAWTQDEAVSVASDATRIALAAQHNTLAACWFRGSGDSVYGQTVISYLDGAYAWHNYNLPDNTATFTWDSSYIASYWRFGPSWVAGTCLTGSGSSATAHLQMVRWDRNFAGFELHSETLDGGQQTTWAGGNVLFNAGALYRYNGYQWVKYASKLSAASGDLVAATDDTVLRVRANGSYYTENELCCFDAQHNDWTISAFEDQAGLQTYQYGAGPQFAGDFLSVSNQVFYRGSDVAGSGAWQPVASHNPLTHCSGSTLTNLASDDNAGFVAWQSSDNRNNPDPDSLAVYAALPKNGDLLSVSSGFTAQRLQSLDDGAVLAGATAFATYDATATEFSQVGQFTLHRVLNHQLSDLSTTVVAELTIDTGQQQLTTRYDYDAASALFDPSGTVAQFPQVTTTRVSAIDGSDIGQTVYRYYNGQAPSSALDSGTETCLAGCGDGGDLCAHYSLANGYLHQVTEYNGAGLLVAQMTNSWVPVTLDDSFTPLQQRSLLRSAQVTHAFANLDVINLDGSTGSGQTATLSRTQSYAYDPATGQISSNSLTQYNSQGEQETRRVDYGFAWSSYSGMADARRLKELAQVTLSVTVGQTTTNVQSFVQTWNDDWGAAAAVWDKYQAWTWLGGSNPITFDFSQTEHDGWTGQASIDARNPAGLTTLTSDAIATPTATLYDSSGLWPVGVLVNAASGLYCGFESYEDLTGWTLTGAGQVVTGDAHSGRRCAHIPAAGGIEYRGLSVDAGQWVFSCRVKSPAGSDASWTLQTGSDSRALAVPSSADWAYLFDYLTVDQDGSAVTLSLTNQDGGTLLLDEVRLTPLTSTFAAKVYDDRTWYTVAKLGSNGETTRSFFDDRLRVVAGAGPDENLDGIQSLYYSDAGLAMFDADDPKPNSSLRIKAADGGPWDDFRDSDWAARWSGDSDAWAVTDQTLTHQTSGLDSLTLNGSDDYRNYAVQVRVTSDTLAGDLGITVGSGLTVEWNAAAGQWQMRLDDQTVASASRTPSASMHWLLVAGEQGLLFYLNDEPLLSYAADTGTSIGGALGLFAEDAGVGFSQVLVALTPLTRVSYLDGTHQAVQHQQLADNQIILAETLFDELGRPTVHTKPAILDDCVGGYQADFVQALDFTSGLLSGTLSDYYAGQDGRSDDGGYPYWRRVLEDSSLARPLAAGKPGPDYAIGPPDSLPTTFEYGVNGPGPLFDSAAEQQYKLGLTIDPQGNAMASLTDLLGNRVGRVYGTIGEQGELPSDALVDACVRDYQDNPAEIRSPNWFDPPSGDADDWRRTASFDFHNRPISGAGADQGQTDSVRDAVGRLRFKLIADGTATDSTGASVNPCAGDGASPVAVLYAKYDARGRVTEQGHCCVADWSEVAGYADDPDWPSDATGWHYRHSYDGDGSQPYCIGRVTSVQVNNAGTVATESYQYDIRGRITAYTVDDGQGDPLTTRYSHDCIGRPTAVDYPAMGSLNALAVTYSYDARGLLAGIGDTDDPTRFASYSYNAAGQVQTAVLGTDDPITRSYGYSSAGWPRSIVDSGSGGTLASETLYYDQDNNDASNDPRWDGLLSAVDYSRSIDGADYRWTFRYDDNARLASAELAGGDTRGYQYDPNGNPTRLSVGDGGTDLVYDGSNRLQSAAATDYSSGPSGEVTAAGQLRFGYDFNSRLPTSIQDQDSGQTLTLNYGAGAQRLRKQLSDAGANPLAWRRYLPGPRGHALQEQAWDASSNQTSEVRYIRGPHGIVALLYDGNDYALLHDHERSPRVLLAGASAAPVALFDYLPFGGALASGGSDPSLLVYRYGGQEWDAETGLYNDRHRLYDPGIARFLAPDPAHQYFSPYQYVADHPLLLTDPTGEFGWANLGGIEQSTMQIGIGAIVVAGGAVTGDTAVMAAGGALIGGGVATMDYSITTKHFSESQYWQIDATATISTAEMEAGMLITAASGGVLANSVGGGLTGAGAGGYGNVLMQVNQHPNGKFDWKAWGIAEGTGFVIGAVSGGLGAWLGPAAETGEVGAEAGGDDLLETPDIEDGAPRKGGIGNEFDGDDEDAPQDERKPFNPRRYAQSIAAKTFGKFVGGMAGETFNYAVTHKHFNAKTWIIDSAIAGGEQAATQFATGLVFEAYSPTGTGSQIAYALGKRAVRSGIAYGWSQLIKRP